MPVEEKLLPDIPFFFPFFLFWVRKKQRTNIEQRTNKQELRGSFPLSMRMERLSWGKMGMHPMWRPEAAHFATWRGAEDTSLNFPGSSMG
jgi:hypothetical protein